MNNKFILDIGDPGGDGHGKSDSFTVLSNKTNLEIETAYQDSCKLTGLVFDENNKSHGYGDYNHPEYDERRICVEYESYKPSKLALNILKKFDIEYNNDRKTSSEFKLATLFLDFIKLSLKDFEYKIINEPRENVLNISIGYGLYE